MGCTQSKIENEEAISRCKDRKQFMKDAVSARNAFAAAHSSYTMSLKNTGAALSDYAHAEVQNHPSYAAAANSASVAAAAANSVSAATQPSFESLPPPPPPLPPLPNFSPSPLQRAATMPEIKMPPQQERARPVDTIIEEENEDDAEGYEQAGGLKTRSRSTRGAGGSNNGRVRSMSVDDHEDDGPPPPPSLPRAVISDRAPPPMPVNKESTWDFFFAPAENMPGPSLSEVEDIVVEEKEIERNVFEDKSKRSENGVGGDRDYGNRFGKSEVLERVVETPVEEPPPPPVAAKKMKTEPGMGMVEGRRPVKSVANVNLVEIFMKLDDHFLKASESAHEVSKMLEATRLHYHSNFADNRGHIDHSARVMRVITWNRSFRGQPNADDEKDDFDSEENETHATVLDKLLAWEKKLYDEVKAGELMKFEYHRKVAQLGKQKKRNPNSDSLEKLKATVSHLHTRYIVDMQSLDSTVSEINRLRDDQLYPKLVSLVDGMATMWETMRFHHESQSKIVAVLRSVEISQAPGETSVHHHERTIQLGLVIEEWHEQFHKLVINQKDYVKFLSNWLKLNLVPIESSLREKVSSPARPQNPPIQKLLRSWHDYLEKLPDEGARSAIINFATVVNAIIQHQKEKITMKEKCEETRRELGRKTRQFEDWYHKYSQRKMPEDVDPDRTENNIDADEAVTQRKLVVDLLKKRLEDEEEAYQKQCLQVREKSWTNLKSLLPDLFRSLSDFSVSCSEMYRNLRSISLMQHNSPTESLP